MQHELLKRIYFTFFVFNKTQKINVKKYEYFKNLCKCLIPKILIMYTLML